MRRKNALLAGSLAWGLVFTLVTLFFMTSTSKGVSAEPSVVYVSPGAACNGVTPCFGSIQGAVDYASSDDEIHVSTGTFTGVSSRGGENQVVYISKTITIRGGYSVLDWNTSEPETYPTTLDAQGAGRGVTIAGVITPTLESLRLTNGYAEYGGGIYVLDAGGTISNCVIYSNTAHSSSWGVGGGGVRLESTQTRLSANTIISNTAYRGGGVYVWISDDSVIDNNEIINNRAYYWSGAMYLHFSGATVRDNTIQENVADYDGAGIGLQTSNAFIENNFIKDNRTPGSGGGISSWQGDTSTLYGNTIIGNSSNWGGGVELWESPGASLDSNIIISNTAQSQGGGIWIYDSQGILLTNNIVAQNTTNGVGGGIYAGGSEALLLHTTLADNTDGDDSGIFIEDTGSYTSEIELINSIIAGHAAGVSIMPGNSVALNSTLWYGNMIDWDGGGTINHMNDYFGDPAFVDPGGWNYHVRFISAAVDKGINAGLANDIDGQPRPAGKGYDLGADEVMLSVYIPAVVR